MSSIPHLGNSTDQTLKEYIVSLKSMSDSDEFYKDMETEGGNLYIPNRAVECKKRRPVSRNTHYMLTYDEAAQILNDPRVESVILNYKSLGAVRGTFGFTQTSANFDKRTASDPNDINWGLLRCLYKTNPPNWGIGATPALSDTIYSDCSGKNVDVVIMDDGCPYPFTFEYSQNADGTGYSRMIEYNWFQHNPTIDNSFPTSVYHYNANRLQEHGAHTTGTTAGNTQGWARDANIYNITFYDDIDYVREFHKNKPINPLTGVKNPTIMNNSWGYRANLTLGRISKFTIRGVDYYPQSGSSPNFVWNNTFLDTVARFKRNSSVPFRDTATDIDMIDAMEEGIVVVASAGNSAFYVDVPGGPDYDNTCVFNNVTYYIHRGSSPGSANGGTENTKVICVGAAGPHNGSNTAIWNATGIESNDYRAEFSNYGPRIDVYAPGSAIQSIWVSNQPYYDSVMASTDPRVAILGGLSGINNFLKIPGTSMSGPQVAGILACIAEKYPRMTQADARSYIKQTSPNTILSTSGGTEDSQDAGISFNPSSNNQMILLKGTRIKTMDDNGDLHKIPYPEISANYRPESGQLVPRQRNTYRYQNSRTFSVTANPPVITNGQSSIVTINANVPNGTVIPYIITGKTPVITSPSFDTGLSAVCDVDFILADLDTSPNSAFSIQTVDEYTVVVAAISQEFEALFPLNLFTNSSTSPTSGNNNDGFWQISLPWNFEYLGTLYNEIFVGTNSYITFGSGSDEFFVSPFNPPISKIMISSGDNSCQRIFYETIGTSPNRLFCVRFQGHVDYTGGILGSPTLEWEARFFESSQNQVDIHIGINDRQLPGAPAQFSITPSEIGSVPLTNFVTINNGTANLTITAQTLYSYMCNVRLGIFPAPNTNLQIN